MKTFFALAKHIITVTGVVAIGLAVTGCRSVPVDAGESRFVEEQPHMGTVFRITLYAPEATAGDAAFRAAFDRVAELDRMMSDYDQDSELMQLCRQPVGQPVRVSADLFRVLTRAQQLAEQTDGAFDVTIGPVVRQWRRARRTAQLPSPEQLARAFEPVGWWKLKLDARRQTVTLLAPNMQLDLGGIAKGYAADAALEALSKRGITRALVAASGDIAVGDPPPRERGWRVSIGAPVSAPARSGAGEHHGGSETGAPMMRTLLLKNAAVSTSGDTEQFVEIGSRRYSHIVDPRTGVGLTEPVQVTVIARRAMDTDSLATAVSVLGVERGLQLIESQRGAAALIWPRSGNLTQIVASSRFARFAGRE